MSALKVLEINNNSVNTKLFKPKPNKSTTSANKFINKIAEIPNENQMNNDCENSFLSFEDFERDLNQQLQNTNENSNIFEEISFIFRDSNTIKTKVENTLRRSVPSKKNIIPVRCSNPFSKNF